MASPEVAGTEGIVRIEGQGARSDVILVCEHASRRIPAELDDLGLDRADLSAHVVWDPGALGVARGLARRLDATLVAAEISRLVYDLNRPPHSSSAMSEQSEVYAIPGNRGLSQADRLARVESVYLPFHQTLHRLIAERLAQGRAPAIVTVHSFTPVYFGKPRDVEFGIIHDALPELARRVHAAALARTGLRAELNQPYSAEDGVTHMLRLQAVPYGLANVMLEIRNDLIANPDAEEAMADLLFPVLTEALQAPRQTKPAKVS